MRHTAAVNRNSSSSIEKLSAAFGARPTIKALIPTVNEKKLKSLFTSSKLEPEQDQSS
jgi:hypothetical protein